MAGKIRMGVIGAGSIARGVHIPGILRSPDAELAAVCDIKPQVLAYCKDNYGIDDDHLFTDRVKMFESGMIDAVSICTPNNVHVEIALDAVKYSKPFAVEKPISTNRFDAVKLYEAVKAAGIPSMICFSYRFKAAARYMRDLILNGEIGTVRHVYAQYMQGWGSPKLNCAKVWRFDKEISGSGTLGDLGSHMIDLVRFITDSNYVNVTAQLGTFMFERRSADPSKSGVMEKVDVDDYSHYMALTDTGIATSFEITRNGFGRGNYQRVEVYGDEGALIYGLEHTDTLEICKGDEARKKCEFSKLDIPEKYNVDQMQCFFDLINGNSSNLTATIEDGYLNQIMLDSIIESSEKGMRIELK